MINVVYVIGPDPLYPGAFVKIGVSNRVRERLQKFQCGSPVRLAVLWAVPGDRTLEQWLHREFEDRRQHGEWFDLGPDPVKLIQDALGPYLSSVITTEIGEFPIMASETSEDFEEDDVPYAEKRHLTVAEAAEFATRVRGRTVTSSTIRTWKHRGHLVPAPDMDGTLFEPAAVAEAAVRNGSGQPDETF